MSASQATAPSRRATPEPAPAAATAAAVDSASDVVRWAAFSCALVPFVLLVYGTSFGAAAGTALGLGAVTATCRLLLRRCARAAVPLLPEPSAAPGRGGVPAPHRGRHSRSGTGAHRGGRHGAVGMPGD